MEKSNAVKCPSCDKVVTVLMPWVVGYLDPRFNCKKCKYKGRLVWNKPE